MLKKNKVMSLYEKGLKGHEIAKVLGYGRSYVYRIIAKLEYVPKEGTRGGRVGDASPLNDKNVHAQKVRFHVHFMSDKYKSNPNSVIKDFIPDVNIVCKGRFIYATTTRRFFGSDEVSICSSSISFWDGVVSSLENRFNIGIYGRGKIAYEFSYEETETINSPLGLYDAANGKRTYVFHSDDGKLRLSTDWSGRTPNSETHHFRDGHADSIAWSNFTNDTLNNPDLSLSVLKNHIISLAHHNKDTAEALNVVTHALKVFTSSTASSDVPLVDDIVVDYVG